MIGFKFKALLEDKEMNVFEKGMGLIVGGIASGLDLIEEKTGVDLVAKQVEQQEKDDELKKKNPVLHTLKHLGIGTLKGITGSSFSK